MKGWFLVFLMLTLTSSSYAVMLSPPSYDIEFKPNAVSDCSFAVKNTASNPIDFSLYTDGDLNGSIKLSEESVRIEPNVWHGFSCTLTLPEDLTPGLHPNSVVVMEGNAEKGMVGAVAGVKMLLNVRKPYPGKYIEADLQVSDSQINKPVNFRLLLTSRGSETIDSAKASFQVYAPTGELLATIPTDSIGIPPGGIQELTASWTHGEAGVYHVIADVSYDGSSLTAEKDFRVGDLLIKIINVSAPDAKAGGIARVFVSIQSFWNERIDNVYASLTVTDPLGNVVASAESPSITVGPWESKPLTLYFDTSGLTPSTYDLDVSLRYSNKTSEASGSIRVVKPFPTVIVLAALIIVILALAALYFFRFRGRKKKGSEK